MDVELARTFLEILRCGSFVQAADVLHVTQTTVTVRVKTLESRLGKQLFVRSRRGVKLTAEGERFVPYASSLVQLWERAQHEVRLTGSHQSILQIGGELSLWNPLLLNWLLWLRREMPTTAIRSHVEVAQSLVRKVEQGVLDIAVVYTTQYHPGVRVRKLMEETLVMVSTSEARTTGQLEDYVYIDWGPDFTGDHDKAFPEFRQSSLAVGLGPLALQYILRVGGTGYFRYRAVKPYLDKGVLFRVKNAPEFQYPVYAIAREDQMSDAIDSALGGLMAVANDEENDWLL